MVTLRDAARSLADTLGGSGLFTITAAPDVDDPDARRTLISSELVDEDRDPTSFNDYTVYAAGGALDGQQVAVRREGYDATNGIIYTSGLFSAAPQVGQEIEYHARLPRKRHFGEPGLREILNQALDRLWFTDELVYSATALTTYAPPSWLLSDRQIVMVKDADVMAGVNPVRSARTATLVHDTAGTLVQLSATYASGTPFRLVTRRPHRSWIRVGGVWGDSTAGLVDDDDETMCDEQALLIVATWRAYRALSRRSPDFELGPWRRDELEWETKASLYLQWSIDTSSPLTPGSGGGGHWAKSWTPG